MISGHRPVGFKESEETKLKRSRTLKGRLSPHKGESLSEEHKRRISESAKSGKTGRFARTNAMNTAHSQRVKGKKRTSKMKERYRIAALSRPKKLCSYCQREIAINVYDRWHRDNCKQRIVQ